jgi:hypothetical protein
MIFSRELWFEIGHTVLANPLRTALTGLSVGLGIFILVVMQGLGFGLATLCPTPSQDPLGTSGTETVTTRAQRALR